MSRLSGNLGTQGVSQSQNTQRAEGGGFKGFMMSIGQGLSRAGNAIAHFFGSSVPTFFKSLGERSATNVATTDKPRSMMVEDDSKLGGSTTSDIKSTVGAKNSSITKSVAFSKSASLDNVDWTSATDFKPIDSGNGGIVLVNFGKSNLVIKGGGSVTGNEVLGARLAREMGFPAPETRVLSKQEQSAIAKQMRDAGVSMPERRGGTSDDATIVMEFIDGSTLGKQPPVTTKAEAAGLCQAIGRWVAFDAVIFEKDRFNSLNPNGGGNGVNTANFMINGGKPGEIIGIDQVVTPGDSTDFIRDLMKGDEYRIAGFLDGVQQSFGKVKLKEDEAIKLIADSIKSTFAEMGATLTDQRIDQLAGDLALSGKPLPDLKERLALVRELTA